MTQQPDHATAAVPTSTPPPAPPGRGPNGHRATLTVAATVAPIALIGGWIAAGAAQPGGYSAVSETISALAATTARDRWIMTTGFVVTGVCLVLIGLLVGAARPAGRVALVAAGAGVLGVSAAPLPTYSAPHTLLAWLSFFTLAVWPVLGMSRTATSARLRPAAAVTVTVLFVLLILLVGPAGHIAAGGLCERLLAGGEILWVAAAVLGPGGRR